jgi:S-adenosylmethionine synthetase
VRNFVMTSEAVTIGHPDKLCDQISDAIVDGCLAAGQRTRLSAECALANGVVFLSIRSGEELAVDPTSVARQILNEAGYKTGPSGVQPTVIVDLSHAEAVPRSADGHAGISQMVTAFGYACVGYAGTDALSDLACPPVVQSHGCGARTRATFPGSHRMLRHRLR